MRLLSLRISFRMLRTHRNVAEAEPGQHLANRAFVQMHAEARRHLLL